MAYRCKSCSAGFESKDELFDHFENEHAPYKYGSLAREAGDIVEQRALEYGPPETNLNHVAELWSAYLGIELTGWDYAAMMMMAKIARGYDGAVDEDTAKDIAGYADAGWATVVDRNRNS